MRFENDDALASQGASHFQAILRAFGLDRAQEYVIPSDDVSPAWSVRAKVEDWVSTNVHETRDSIRSTLTHLYSTSKEELTVRFMKGEDEDAFSFRPESGQHRS